MFLHAKFLRFFCVILVFVPGILSFSCSNSIDHMLEDYNSNFVHKVVEEKTLEPGDLGYNPDNMLLPEYFVALNASLNIPASDRGRDFTWTMTKLNKSNGIRKTVFKSKMKNFVLQVSDHDEIEEGTYCLTLELTIASGELFMDEAFVFVYDQTQRNKKAEQ